MISTYRTRPIKPTPPPSEVDTVSFTLTREEAQDLLKAYTNDHGSSVVWCSSPVVTAMVNKLQELRAQGTL